MAGEHNMDIALREDNLRSLIYTVRGAQVMLDSDLAHIYQVETKMFNRAVKRNIERFPDAFRFQLTKEEYENLRCQFGTSSQVSQNEIPEESVLKSQPVTSSDHGGRRYLPYAFTEQGVAMLSAVLRSETAILDDSVLQQLAKRRQGVSATILTRTISKALTQDLKKHNSQYPAIRIHEFGDSHDRFLILDGEAVYHLGASLKDLGKKWFAFSRMDKSGLKVMERLNAAIETNLRELGYGG